MKKIVFLTVMLILSIAAYAQDSISKDIPISETERIIDKYLDKTGEALSNLAQTLKVPAGHVYEVLVRQQIAQGISITLGAILISVLLIIVVRSGIKNDWDDEWQIPATIALCILWLIIICTTIFMAIPSMINPEYGAMKEIMDLL